MDFAELERVLLAVARPEADARVRAIRQRLGGCRWRHLGDPLQVGQVEDEGFPPGMVALVPHRLGDPPFRRTSFSPGAEGARVDAEFRVGGKSRPRDLHFDDVFGAQPREHPPPAFPRRRVPLEEVGVERQGDATGKQDPVGPGAHQVRLE
jgi:hypothetical protein